MVSRYRDIIETNQASLSRTASFMSATNSIRNGENWFFFIKLFFYAIILGSIMESNTDTGSLNGLSSIVAPITKNNV